MAAGVVYVVLGDPTEALMLLGFVVLITEMTLYQENKTERALDRLRGLASPGALVIRDGRQRRILGRDVVRGNIVLLDTGDMPADGVVLSATNLSVDESLLPGEEKRLVASPTRLNAPTTVRGVEGGAVGQG